MGKGQIINNFGDGRYAVKLLQNREKADQALARIDTWIVLNQTRQDALLLGDPEHKLPMLKLSMASLLKQKEYLLLIPQDAIASAWCADRTEGLSGIVGTIEINGSPSDNVNIRPGYTDQAAYLPARDGQAMNILAMTPEQAFYNLAMMPGWQKWRPTYRVGAITSIDVDTCSVRLDDANSSLKGAEYNINQAWDLTNVGIEYMSCNGAAFDVGDRVIVKFVNQDFKKPMVIGFENNPKPCDADIFFFQPHSIGTSNFVGVYNIKGVCVQVYDINALVGADADEPVYVDDINSDLNTVIIRGSKEYQFPPPSVPMWLSCSYRFPIFWQWIEDNVHEIFYYNCDSYSSMAAGGYMVGVSQTILTGWKIEQDPATSNFQVVQSTWVDIDHDNIVEPNEIYPLDYDHRTTVIKGVAWHYGELIMAVYRGINPDHSPSGGYSDAYMTDCFLGVFTGPQYIDQGWYYQSDPNWIDMYLERKIFDIATIAEFERIVRIICYDGRMFIFKSGPTALELYDMYGSLLAMCPPAEPGACTKPYILNYNGKMVLCAQWYAGRLYKSPVVFYDIDTLDVVHSVIIPGSIETSNSIMYLTLAACNRPILNKFILAFNIKRRTFTPPRKPTSYSTIATQSAQEHADWCVENSKIEFNEGSIDTHERQREFGIFDGGTAFFTVVSGLIDEEYNQILANPIWGQLGDIEGIGLGVASFPVSCEKYSFLGVNVDIPVNQRGLIKVYVCDYYWY